MSAVWSWRSFWIAFILSLCVLGLVCAFLTIDYTTRHVSYGQVDFGVAYALPDGTPRVTVEEETLAVPAAKTAEEVLLPAPLRLFIALWRWENVAVERVWERLLAI